MGTITTSGVDIYFNEEERGTAEIVQQACEKSIQILGEQWDLRTPADCHIYVMTSWADFIFRSAPWHWKVLLVLTYPLWVFRVRRTWQFAGGWTQRYGRRCAVGVKPARLIEQSDRSMGERIFVEEESFENKVRSITCHELTHAFVAHLRLPMWLNEGFAMATVDKFAGKPTVLEDTLLVLKHSRNEQSPGSYRKVSVTERDAMVYHTVRGYWITRYLMETRPELLRGLLDRRRRHKVLEEMIASSYDMNREEFWRTIDAKLVTQFLTNR
jgi:hypothetical protein